MATREFPGVQKLIEACDSAVSGDCPYEITTCLRNALCELIAKQTVQLPDCCYQPLESGYARRELHTSKEHGYAIIAMTWGPGQGTPIHDHSGMWCVEGVWSGRIEVAQYEIQKREGDRFQFEHCGSIQAGTGSAGSLIPPHEYHTICNPCDEQTAVTVHIYSAQMQECNVFQPNGEAGWYERQAKQLALD